MPTFILRQLDPEFWAKVQAKAAAEGTTVKAVILRLLAAWLAAAVLLSVTGCAYKNPIAPSTIETPTAGVPTRIELTANPGLGAQAGTGTITARVLDGFSSGLAGQTVTFAASQGALGAAQTVTDDKGIARTTITGPAGAGITIRATAGTVTQQTLIAMQTTPDAPLPVTPPTFPPPTSILPSTPTPTPTPTPALSIALASNSATNSVAVGHALGFGAVVHNPDGETIFAYQWDVDGTTGVDFTTTDPVILSRAYTTAGLFTAHVTVITTAGHTATATLNFVVTN